jgi:hypothetical protein
MFYWMWYVSCKWYWLWSTYDEIDICDPCYTYTDACYCVWMVFIGFHLFHLFVRCSPVFIGCHWCSFSLVIFIKLLMWPILVVAVFACAVILASSCLGSDRRGRNFLEGTSSWYHPAPPVGWHHHPGIILAAWAQKQWNSQLSRFASRAISSSRPTRWSC